MRDWARSRAGSWMAGGRLGVSSRALGSLKEKNGVKYVQEDLWIATAADIVVDPSAPDAFVDSVMENAEWVFEGGEWTAKYVQDTQRAVRKASKAEFEQLFLESFESYLKNL